MLKNPDFRQIFQVQTDASDVGVGAILSQGGDSDRRKLLDKEKRYSTIEKECLAILLGVKAFAIYNVPPWEAILILQKDNRTQLWLKSFKDSNARLT